MEFKEIYAPGTLTQVSQYGNGNVYQLNEKDAISYINLLENAGGCGNQSFANTDSSFCGLFITGPPLTNKSYTRAMKFCTISLELICWFFVLPDLNSSWVKKPV